MIYKYSKKQLQFISAEHSNVQFIFNTVFWLCKMTITCVCVFVADIQS